MFVCFFLDTNAFAIDSAPLGSYTPVKGAINTNFELGVTRSSPATTTSSSNSSSKSPSPTQQEVNQADSVRNGATGGGATLSGTDAATVAAATSNGGRPSHNGTEPPDSLQYLKPATDDQTVVWSEGTRATDLLF